MSNFYSISQHPGKTGETFYNTLFKLYDLPHTYTALKSENLTTDVEWLRNNAAGFSVSMPFKSEIIDLLDVVDHSVLRYGSCNTVVVREGRLYGFTADMYGALHTKMTIPVNSSVSILGNGNIGNMLSIMLNHRCRVFSRKKGNWDKRHEVYDVIINATSFGTSTPDSPLEFIPKGTKMVIDVALKPNQLKEQCLAADVKYVSGLEFYKAQFKNQFHLYTGIQPKQEDIENICSSIL